MQAAVEFEREKRKQGEATHEYELKVLSEAHSLELSSAQVISCSLHARIS